MCPKQLHITYKCLEEVEYPFFPFILSNKLMGYVSQKKKKNTYR